MAQKVKVEKDNAERWLLTYADLMNLLLILFIILYSMSQVDAGKFQQLSQSLSSAFGDGNPVSVVQGSGSGNSLVNFPATMPSPVIPSQVEDQQIDAATKEISELIKSEGLAGKIGVELQERGIKISIQATLIFKSGSAEIEKQSEDTVLKIGRDVLTKLPKKHIRIEGHTDDIPMKSAQFPSNWELSSARATNVLRLLVDQAGVDPAYITSVGCGEFSPEVKNDSDEHRKQNRRVDIVILRDASSQGESNAEKASGK